jgi:hypothetical protein
LTLRSRRIAVLGLSVLLLVIYPFNRSVRRIAEEEVETVSRLLQEVDCVAGHYEKDVSYVFYLLSSRLLKKSVAARL